MTEAIEGDIAVLAIFLLVLTAILLFSELLHSKWSWRSESSRRLVHALTGIVVVISIGYFESPLYLYVFAAIFAVSNYFFSRRKILAGIHAIERHSLGTVTFPLALILGLYLSWSLEEDRKAVLQMAFLIMAISDPLASFFGTRFGKEARKILREKTWVGVSSFVLSAALLFYVFDSYLLGFQLSAIQILVFSLLLGLIELISRNGWDNLFIVLAVISMLTWGVENGGHDIDLIVSALAVLVFMLFSLKLKYLNKSGAIAAGILGFTLLLVGSWTWVIPALVFFATSSWLSKFRPKRDEEYEPILEKGSTRDDGQVWANGGVAILIAVLSLFFPSTIWFNCLVASFAAAAADTWATEIGMRWGMSPRSILNFQAVDRGVSGGVSLYGLLGSLFGSFAISATFLFLSNQAEFEWSHFFIILAAGFFASLLDSVLGATLQAKYEDSMGAITEQRTSAGGDNTLLRGFEFVDNDLVNLFSIASASILVLIAHQIF